MPALSRRIALLALLLSSSLATFVRAESPRRRAWQAMTEMHRWVGSGENGRRWKSYLRSQQLLDALQLGEFAEPSQVQAVLERYQSGAAGLDEPRFARVRRALKDWLAELRGQPAEDLAAATEKAAADYQPISDEQVEAARERLAKGVERLAELLEAGRKHAEGWRNYLLLDELQEQLAAGNEADLKTLVKIYRRFTANHEGLELPRFADVAAALSDYMDVLLASKVENPEQQHAATVERLAELLESYAESRADETRWTIGQLLGSLAVSQQDAEFVKQVRHDYSKPNLSLSASERLFDAALSRRVDRWIGVRDYILGARIVGDGHLVGRVSVDLLPSLDRAAVVTELSGEIDTYTTGYHDPISFRSRGTTTVSARKRTEIDETGLTSYETETWARTDNQVQRIYAGRLAANIARRRIAEQRSEANWIAARHAEERLNRRYDREASEQLSRAKQRFQERFRLPLLRRREFPELFQLSTTDDELQLLLLKSNRFQLAAPEIPPQLEKRGDFSVRVHESLPGNFIEALWGGRTFTDEEIRQRIIDVRGSLPEEMKPGPEEEPWSITLARQQPITVRFEDGTVEVTIRGRHYTSGGREFEAMNVTARYHLELSGGGMKITREGDLTILPPGFDPEEDTLSPSQVALKEILLKKFGKAFKPEFQSEGIELPGTWKKAGTLHPVALASQSGWLSIGWELSPGAAKQVAGGTNIRQR